RGVAATGLVIDVVRSLWIPFAKQQFVGMLYRMLPQIRKVSSAHPLPCKLVSETKQAGRRQHGDMYQPSG
ncbi:MAG: hypothetical protein AAGC96_17345, partial [Pseudomonadota bacterium]